MIRGGLRGVKEWDGEVLVQFDVARASCACLHGRDARATFSNCTGTAGDAPLVLPSQIVSMRNPNCHIAIQLLIARAIHFTHSTRAEFGADFVAAEFCAGGNVHLGGTSSQLALLRQSHAPQQVGVAWVAAERLVGYIPSDSRQ